MGADRNTPARRGWRLWLLLLAAFMSLAAVVTIAGVAHVQRAYRSAERAALDSQAAAAASLAQGVAASVTHYVRVAEVGAQAILGGRPPPADRHALLASIRAAHPEVNGVALIDPRGRVIDGDPIGAIGVDVSAEPAVRALLAGENVVVSDLTRGRTGTPFFGVAAAHRDAQGRLLGAVAIGVPAARLADELRVRLGGGAYPVLIDRAGRLMVYGGSTDLTWEQRDFAAVPILTEAARGGQVRAARVLDALTGEERLVAMTSVPGIGWVVAVLQSPRLALAPAYRELRAAVWTTVAVCALAVGLALALSAFLARPLIGLSAGLAAIRRGDLRHRTKVRGPEGLVSLAADLNDLAAQLQAKEAALAESRSRFDAFMTHSPIRAYIKDARGRYVYVNRVTEEESHRPAAEWLGKTDADLFPADVAERLEQTDREVMQTGSPVKAVERIHDSLGARELLSAKFRLADSTGQLFVGGLSIDVTEQRRAEAALAAREAFLQAIIDRTPALVFVKDLEGRYLLANRRFLAVHGFGEPSQVLGKRDADIHAPHLAALYHEHDLRVIEAGGPVEFEEPVAQADGLHTFMSTKFPLYDERGAPYAVCGIETDITERTRTEAALRLLDRTSAALGSSLDYETTLALIARLAVPDLADWCVIDLAEPDGRFRAVAMTHREAEKATRLKELADHPPAPEGAYPAAHVIRTGRPELLPVVPDGWIGTVSGCVEHRRILEAVGVRSFLCVPLVARGRALGALSLVISESERRYTEADLPVAEELGRRAALAVDNARLYREAQEAVRARDAFLARASHELRTPLTSALGTIRLLGRAMTGVLRESPDTLLDIATRNLQTMAALVDDLLDASKLAAHGETIAREPVDLRVLVRDSLAVFGALAREQGVTLEATLPEGCLAAGDRLKLEQLVTNLVSNAIKFTPPGGTVLVEGGVSGDQVELRVRDTGEGIPREYLERIFEPFFRVPRPAGRGPRGTGLGLAICRQVAALHGGTIGAQSEGPGRGSTFVVRLPRAAAEERAQPAA
ncbi:MAG TPA: PAS domain-containing protein, partial [Thermodesulfobacteriota bacterium]